MSSPMELELELDTGLSNPTPCDSSSAWIYRPQSISDVQAAAYAVEWDNSDRMMQESAERALAILGPVKIFSMSATIASASILMCSMTAPATCSNLF